MKYLLLNLCLFTVALSAAETPQLVTTQFPNLALAQAEPITRADSKCVIEQNVCNNYPGLHGSFSDTYDNSQFVAGRCLYRAKEYSLWCANPTGETTKATFTSAEGKKLSTTFKSPGTSCRIEQSRCYLYPMLKGSFADAFDGSDQSLHRCVKRAQEYSAWCANPKGEVTKAVFYAADGTSSTHSYKAAATNCQVTQTQCKKYEGAIGVFADLYANASQVASRCLARAEDYAKWCGNTSGMTTTTKFTHEDGSEVESTYIVP